MPIGPLMIDLQGQELTAEDIELLAHPLVGGVILFGRNYHNIEQLTALIAHIRRSRSSLLIGIDQEGGRVQPFVHGFTRLPSANFVGELYDRKPDTAKELAFCMGWLLASELNALDIPINFAPVIDLDWGYNQVVSDRSFHRLPTVVTELATAYLEGAHCLPLTNVAKHFPGHGFVRSDSHIDMPIDTRTYNDIEKNDLKPFVALIQEKVKGMMPAHITFEQIDNKPVSFSSHWLKTVLREQLGFRGVIFSDDLNMKGASFFENYTDRVQSALEAGCDMCLLCNNREAVTQVLDRLDYRQPDEALQRLLFVAKQSSVTSYSELRKSREWQQRVAFIDEQRYM